MIGGVASSSVQRLNGKAEPYRTVRRHSRSRSLLPVLIAPRGTETALRFCEHGQAAPYG
jgi:hypothetical protein